MLARLKISLDNKTKIYEPGTEILGSVSVSSLGAISLAGLEITLTGTMKTMQVQGPYSEINDQQVFCEQTMELVPEDSKLTSADQKTFPFVIAIPGNAPPSVVVNLHNRIYYTIKASLRGSKTAMAAERNVYMVAVVDDMKAGFVNQLSHMPVSNDSRAPLISYGTPTEAAERAELLTPPLSLDQAGDSVSDIGEPSGRFAGSAGSALLSVDFPVPGIYTDDKLNMPVNLKLFGDMPPLTLKALNITIVVHTVMRTLGKLNEDVKHKTIFKLEDRRDVSGKTEIDFTNEIFERAVIPDLAPDFERELISRRYTWSVYAALYRGSPSDSIPTKTINLNCRHPLHIFGRHDHLDILPSYSSAD